MSAVALGVVSTSFSFVFLAGGPVIGFAVAPVMKKDIRPTRGKLGPLIWLVAIFDMAGYLFLGAGLAPAGESPPLVIVTSGIGGFVLVCCTAFLRHEKPEPNQLVGIAISVIGVATPLYLTA